MVEALIQYIWNVESHHLTCSRCHPLSEFEDEQSNRLKLPSHPHLKELQRRRKEILRRQLADEGKRVGRMRRENEILGRLLQDDDNDYTYL